ncbi:3-hydroxy-3-methylglutaryl-coenzyme A reductase [Bifidobacterium bohemicum]|uniref:3-hydroxy-3-methylglutaryl coenzyme A reductase n=1 Tax=Bifidobacterium bohemicum DSM 22767 TaxID=1437606 RepID=A0A086ZGY0_9BIFI|nr:hydroxymethylglutaryl-CoA reductase, degradative [Bifidobacterium bohemicum]KFI45780.1 hydroxymethylglutaryl-CoA reductase [Bifidobacterium bohemicum DSM 22767]SCC11252.1 3-hydroxy-3-methylglutaryl-coenzyme A reductase [Bifidobacterium bohemicum]
MTKFYELSTAERIDRLRVEGAIGEDGLRVLTGQAEALPAVVASNMVENHIGAFPVPLGLAEHFVIDGEALRVPMAVEEPSVIAAAGNAAARIARSGGFSTSVRREGVVAQIVVTDARDGDGVDGGGKEGADRSPLDRLTEYVRAHEGEIRRVARQAHPSLERHGGGLRGVEVRGHEDGFAELDLLIDTGEAMGANVVNTIAEAVSVHCISHIDGLDPLMSILSNESAGQRAQSVARIAFDDLKTRDMDGDRVARRIVKAARFAWVSPLRAATHNKGIMNGVNAAVLATGNDTRNINAAAYADLSDRKRTWTKWTIDEDRSQLVGVIDMPLPLGAVGGAMSTLPMARLSLALLGHPSAARLMGIVASVGLASNLSAMRALVTRGIQSGHMNLQFKSLVMSAGARPEELDQVVAGLRADPAHADLAMAKRLLQRLRAESK